METLEASALSASTSQVTASATLLLRGSTLHSHGSRAEYLPPYCGLALDVSYSPCGRRFLILGTQMASSKTYNSPAH